MKLKDLEEVFMSAKDKGLDVYIEVTIPGQVDTEFIINKNASIENKLAYYKKAYDDDLVHAMNYRLRIVNVGVCKWNPKEEC